MPEADPTLIARLERIEQKQDEILEAMAQLIAALGDDEEPTREDLDGNPIERPEPDGDTL
jgi:hypothetical protein